MVLLLLKVFRVFKVLLVAEEAEVLDIGSRLELELILFPMLVLQLQIL